MSPNIDYTFKNHTQTNRQIRVAADGSLSVYRKNDKAIGYFTSELPLWNFGTIDIRSGIHFSVHGHVGGGTYPSFIQESGMTKLHSISHIVGQFGVAVSGGTFEVQVVVEPNRQARISGDFTLAGGTLAFNGEFPGILAVTGNIIWDGGTYVSRIEGKVRAFAECDEWQATGTLTIGSTAKFAPIIPDPEAAEINDRWPVLGAKKALGNLPRLDPNLTRRWRLEFSEPSVLYFYRFGN